MIELDNGIHKVCSRTQLISLILLVGEFEGDFVGETVGSPDGDNVGLHVGSFNNRTIYMNDVRINIHNTIYFGHSDK